jgi:alpha-galactosidase
LRQEKTDNVQKKIVVIGAGSASFGTSTLASLMQSRLLAGSKIALVDIDDQALSEMTRLANRINEEWQAGMTIEASADRRRVLAGADFVIVSIEVPPREKLWRLDWEIPLKHGLRQPYGENGGPGGLMHAFRQIGPFLEIVGDLQDLCPAAWLINFSNPLPRIVRAVTRYSDIKIVGKCHQIEVGYGIAAVLLADHFGYDVPQNVDFHSDPASSADKHVMARLGRQHLDIKAAGLNHFTWMLDVRDRQTGADLYPRLRAAAGRAPAGFEPLSMELFRLFGYCPVPGDTHLCEYLPWTHDVTSRPWEYYNLRLYDWDRSETLRESGRELVMKMASGDSPLEELRNRQSEGATEVIEAISANTNYYDEAVNIPNNGVIPNLPGEAIVEMPAMVGSTGFSGLRLGPLPEPIAELCRREATLVELVVEAAVSGKRELALRALLLDPMINDIARARAILDDYLSVFAEYLPQFASDPAAKEGGWDGESEGFLSA